MKLVTGTVDREYLEGISSYYGDAIEIENLNPRFYKQILNDDRDIRGNGGKPTIPDPRQACHHVARGYYSPDATPVWANFLHYKTQVSSLYFPFGNGDEFTAEDEYQSLFVAHSKSRKTALIQSGLLMQHSTPYSVDNFALGGTVLYANIEEGANRLRFLLLDATSTEARQITPDFWFTRVPRRLAEITHSQQVGTPGNLCAHQNLLDMERLRYEKHGFLFSSHPPEFFEDPRVRDLTWGLITALKRNDHKALRNLDANPPTTTVGWTPTGVDVINQNAATVLRRFTGTSLDGPKIDGLIKGTPTWKKLERAKEQLHKYVAERMRNRDQIETHRHSIIKRDATIADLQRRISAEETVDTEGWEEEALKEREKNLTAWKQSLQRHNTDDLEKGIESRNVRLDELKQLTENLTATIDKLQAEFDIEKQSIKLSKPMTAQFALMGWEKVELQLKNTGYRQNAYRMLKPKKIHVHVGDQILERVINPVSVIVSTNNFSILFNDDQHPKLRMCLTKNLIAKDPATNNRGVGLYPYLYERQAPARRFTYVAPHPHTQWIHHDYMNRRETRTWSACLGEVSSLLYAAHRTGAENIILSSVDTWVTNSRSDDDMWSREKWRLLPKYQGQLKEWVDAPVVIFDDAHHAPEVLRYYTHPEGGIRIISEWKRQHYVHDGNTTVAIAEYKMIGRLHKELTETGWERQEVHSRYSSLHNTDLPSSEDLYRVFLDSLETL